MDDQIGQLEIEGVETSSVVVKGIRYLCHRPAQRPSSARLPEIPEGGPTQRIESDTRLVEYVGYVVKEKAAVQSIPIDSGKEQHANAELQDARDVAVQDAENKKPLGKAKGFYLLMRN